MKRFGIVGWIVLVASGIALAQGADSGDSLELLGGPARHEWQQPVRVLGLLAVQEGEVVADLGAGTGFFMNPLSNIVGAEGQVYAVETDPALVNALRAAESRNVHPNTVVLQGSFTDPKLPEGMFDLVLTVNTWRRLEDRAPMREAVQRALKPGGRFAVIEWREGEVPIAPPPEQRLPKQQLIDEMKADGWTLTSVSRMLPYQYVTIFTPPAP